MEQVRKRADFIEQKAKIEEEKLKVLRRGNKEQQPPGAKGKSNSKPPAKGQSTIQSVEQSIAVNDIYIESIKAKLQLLNR